MSTRWDLYAMDPAFILLGLLVIGFMLFQERLSWKWMFFFIETILYWFANGVLAKWNANLIGVDTSTPGSGLAITLILFATGAFVAIILKPLATWSTGMAHHRRWWMYGSIAATAIALALTFCNAGYLKDIRWAYILVLFITGVLLGMSISANSLYFLFANEQFYYRIAPALTGALMSVTTLFGTFTGDYAMSIDTVLKQGQPDGLMTNQHLVLFVIAMAFLLISTLLMLVNIENPQTVRGFDFEILSELPQYNKKTIWTMVISLVGISAFYALTQSSLVTDFIETKLLIRWGNTEHDSIQQAHAWIRAFHTFNIVPQIIFGYFIYRYITRNVGFKPMMMGAIGLSIVACVILVFTANPYAFIFLNLLMGLVTSQIFFAYFSMAIMWNYRSHGFPVTGFASASNSLGAYLVDTIINELKLNKVGIYKDYVKLDDPTITIDKLKTFNNSADDVTTIMFAGIVVCLVVAELWIYFTAKYDFADYLDLKTANANLRKLLRADTNKKIETRVDDSVLEMKHNEWN